MTPRPDPFGRAIQFIGRHTSVVFLVVVAITAYEVVMRYVFEAPTIWVHEITVLLAAAAFVIGGPLVHASRGHIAISYFFERMPARWQRFVRLFNTFATLVCLVILSYAAIDQAAVSLRDMETSGTALNLPSPPFLKTLFAVACVTLALQTLVHLVQDIAALRGDDR
jgi:TRAP-type mannitol/chloroaromatic compound transport system permease small subunit